MEEQKKAESDKCKKEKDPSNVQKGTIVQLPPKTEKTSMCLMTQLDAQLYCEPCHLMGVGIDEVDFIYDTGTVSGVMGEKEKEILKSVEDEDVLIETVMGDLSLKTAWRHHLWEDKNSKRKTGICACLSIFIQIHVPSSQSR
jgi:hypothetical protein